MEAKNLIRFFFLFAISAVLILASCVKEGPMGLPGVDGVDGVDGKDGKDGVDGTASCVSCHNNATRSLVTAQFATSSHGTMSHAQSGASCVACHSAQGFEMSLTNLNTKNFTAVESPTALTCQSCHSTHNSFDFKTDGQDYALRTTAPVPLYMDSSVMFDLGTSNICVNCHQPRATKPSANADGNFVVANNRYGPHYGTQAVVLQGLWGYHFPQGTTAMPAAGSHAHAKSASCTSCHMHDGGGSAGGHTWKISAESCKSCHSNITSNELIAASKTKFNELYNELGQALLAKGALKENTSGGLEPAAGTYPIDVAGALFNYRMLYGDHSGGIHNPAYTQALLKNSIEALK